MEDLCKVTPEQRMKWRTKPGEASAVLEDGSGFAISPPS